MIGGGGWMMVVVTVFVGTVGVPSLPPRAVLLISIPSGTLLLTSTCQETVTGGLKAGISPSGNPRFDVHPGSGSRPEASPRGCSRASEAPPFGPGITTTATAPQGFSATVASGEKPDRSGIACPLTVVEPGT